MAKYNDLPSLFTAIADTIRAIKGTEDKIVADDFPDALRELLSGHGDFTDGVVGVWENDLLTFSLDTNNLVGFYLYTNVDAEYVSSNYDSGAVVITNALGLTQQFIALVTQRSNYDSTIYNSFNKYSFVEPTITTSNNGTVVFTRRADKGTNYYVKLSDKLTYKLIPLYEENYAIGTPIDGTFEGDELTFDVNTVAETYGSIYGSLTELNLDEFNAETWYIAKSCTFDITAGAHSLVNPETVVGSEYRPTSSSSSYKEYKYFCRVSDPTKVYYYMDYYNNAVRCYPLALGTIKSLAGFQIHRISSLSFNASYEPIIMTILHLNSIGSLLCIGQPDGSFMVRTVNPTKFDITVSNTSQKSISIKDTRLGLLKDHVTLDKSTGYRIYPIYFV
jgi:hypothetical protein